MKKLFIDGACYPNPGGPGGWGLVVYNGQGKRVAALCGHIKAGRTSNNLAEYRALLEALKWLRAHGNPQARVFTDSRLVRQQVMGSWKIKAGSYARLARAAQQEIKHAPVDVIWIPREKNTEADALSKRGRIEGRSGQRALTRTTEEGPPALDAAMADEGPRDLLTSAGKIGGGAVDRT